MKCLCKDKVISIVWLYSCLNPPFAHSFILSFYYHSPSHYSSDKKSKNKKKKKKEKTKKNLKKKNGYYFGTRGCGINAYWIVWLYSIVECNGQQRTRRMFLPSKRYRRNNHCIFPGIYTFPEFAFNSLPFNSLSFNSLSFNSLSFNSLLFNSLSFNSLFIQPAFILEFFWWQLYNYQCLKGFP